MQTSQTKARSSDSAERTLPSVLFVGPGKTGTTWIHEYLAGRDDVVLPEDKESRFFDRYFDRGIGWYAGLFSHGAADAKRIEVCPAYGHCPEAAERIAQTLPHARIVFTLRNPVDRTISHYWHQRRFLGYGTALEDSLTPDSKFIHASRYAEHIARYTATFGAASVGYLVFDDLKKDVIGYARAICHEAGLPFRPPSMDVAGKRANKGTHIRSLAFARAGYMVRRSLRDANMVWAIQLIRAMGIAKINERSAPLETSKGGDAAIRRKIYDLLADDIHALERRLGRTFPDWHVSM